MSYTVHRPPFNTASWDQGQEINSGLLSYSVFDFFDSFSIMLCLFSIRYFRNEESAENVIVKKVGNVTADSEFTYEYGVRRKAAHEKVSDSKTGKSKSEKGIIKLCNSLIAIYSLPRSISVPLPSLPSLPLTFYVLYE